MFSRIARVNQMIIRNHVRNMATHGEHAHTPNPDFWKKVFFFVSCPAIVLAGINTYLLEMEHYHHYHRPEFVPYEHLRIRTRRFPWGDGNHSLFHNPSTNPLPEGWEEDASH